MMVLTKLLETNLTIIYEIKASLKTYGLPSESQPKAQAFVRTQKKKLGKEKHGFLI